MSYSLSFYQATTPCSHLQSMCGTRVIVSHLKVVIAGPHMLDMCLYCHMGMNAMVLASFSHGQGTMQPLIATIDPQELEQIRYYIMLPNLHPMQPVMPPRTMLMKDFRVVIATCH